MPCYLFFYLFSMILNIFVYKEPTPLAIKTVCHVVDQA